MIGNKTSGGRALGIVVGITALVLVNAVGAGAATPISSCTTISSPGTYVLTQSIVNSANSACINITSNNVVFDGAGYMIGGVRGTVIFTQGVYVYNSATALTNVTVKNLILKDWDIGIYYDNTYNGSITNNVASDNINSGISLLDSSNNTLIGNNASNNNIDYGISLDSSNNNMLIGNNASNNNYGISLLLSSNNTLTNNTMTGNEYDFSVGGLQDSAFDNNIDISNIVDGKPVYYIKNGADTVYDSSSNAGTIYCIWCNNVTIKNLTLIKNGVGLFFWKTNNSKVIGINALKNDAGINLGSSNNNTLTDNNASNNNFGIDVVSSNNNTLTDNNVSNNIYSGIQLSFSSNNNTLSKNNASNPGQLCPITFGNSCFGISLFFSSNNTLIGNNASNDNFGILLDGSSNNTLSSNNVSNNNNYGITLHFSSNNTLNSNNVSNNNYGIYMGLSSNNMLSGNTANSNNYAGIYLDSYSNNNTLSSNNVSNNKEGIFLYYSSNNTIYNNFFNNINNFLINNSVDRWNIIKTKSTNIIGGPYLSGNVWANSNGTGFSQTCIDSNSDGICDSQYVLDANNIDYLPLEYNTSIPPVTQTTEPLISGYNLIAIGLIPDPPIYANNLLYTAKGGIPGVTKVVRWNPSDQQWEGYEYIVVDGIYLGNNFILEENRAYFVKGNLSTAGQTYTFKGIR